MESVIFVLFVLHVVVFSPVVRIRVTGVPFRWIYTSVHDHFSLHDHFYLHNKNIRCSSNFTYHTIILIAADTMNVFQCRGSYNWHGWDKASQHSLLAIVSYIIIHLSSDVIKMSPSKCRLRALYIQLPSTGVYTSACMPINVPGNMQWVRMSHWDRACVRDVFKCRDCSGFLFTYVSNY